MTIRYFITCIIICTYMYNCIIYDAYNNKISYCREISINMNKNENTLYILLF